MPAFSPKVYYSCANLFMYLCSFIYISSHCTAELTNEIEAQMVDARRHTVNKVVIGSIVVVTRNEEETVDGSEQMDVGNVVESHELSGSNIKLGTLY